MTPSCLFLLLLLLLLLLFCNERDDTYELYAFDGQRSDVALMYVENVPEASQPLSGR